MECQVAVLQSIQIGCGARPALIQQKAEIFPLGLKRPVRETLNLRPSSAEVKSEWSYTSTPPVHSWRVEAQFYPLLFLPHVPTNNSP